MLLEQRHNAVHCDVLLVQIDRGVLMASVKHYSRPTMTLLGCRGQFSRPDWNQKGLPNPQNPSVALHSVLDTKLEIFLVARSDALEYRHRHPVFSVLREYLAAKNSTQSTSVIRSSSFLLSSPAPNYDRKEASIEPNKWVPSFPDFADRGPRQAVFAAGIRSRASSRDYRPQNRNRRVWAVIWMPPSLLTSPEIETQNGETFFKT